MKESELEMARNLSILTFGTENVSGYIRFLIRNENKKALEKNIIKMERTKDELLLDCIKQFKYMQDIYGHNELTTTKNLILEINKALNLGLVVQQSEQLKCEHKYGGFRDGIYTCFDCGHKEKW